MRAIFLKIVPLINLFIKINLLLFLNILQPLLLIKLVFNVELDFGKVIDLIELIELLDNADIVVYMTCIVRYCVQLLSYAWMKHFCFIIIMVEKPCHVRYDIIISQTYLGRKLLILPLKRNTFNRFTFIVTLLLLILNY